MKGVEIGAVVPNVQRRAGVGSAPQRRDAEALVERDRRAHLEHLASPVNGEALVLRARGDLRDGRGSGLLVGRAAPMESRDRVLVLTAHAQPLALGRQRARREIAHAGRPLAQLGHDLGSARSGAQQLAAVTADVGDRADRDDPARDARLAPADASDDAVPPRDLDQEPARGLGDVRVGGVADDRSERAVDVEQNRGPSGI